MKNDPNIVILVYVLGKEIIKIKDHYEVLEPKIAELEKMGIECSLFSQDREHQIDDILTKAGAKKQLLN